MNDMTDAQISKALALAIGWQESDLYQGGDGSYVAVRRSGVFDTWKVFDYTDETVIWRVAERFDCWPYLLTRDGTWRAVFKDRDGLYMTEAEADTAAKAVALAVIAAHGG